MVKLIIGGYGSGKESRAEKLAKSKDKPYVIIDLYGGRKDDRALLYELQRSRVQDVYLLANSPLDLRKDFFEQFVSEYHIKRNGVWMIYKRNKKG